MPRLAPWRPNNKLLAGAVSLPAVVVYRVQAPTML
jgi:hypothetical protein